MVMDETYGEEQPHHQDYYSILPHKKFQSSRLLCTTDSRITHPRYQKLHMMTILGGPTSRTYMPLENKSSSWGTGIAE